MSDRGSTETESRAGGSTALWVGALVLAAAATAVLVVSSDARLLRLGLVAALWSALIGAFAVARLRNRVAEDEKVAEDRQRIYELELEREIAARREFELEAEAEARRKAAEESDGELKALQAELQRLRTSLEQVLGGDVLFERVALRAESTRVRSLGENSSKFEGQLVQAPQGRELPAAQPQNTELISRLSGEEPREEPRPKQHPKPRLKPQAAQAHPSRPRPARPQEKAHHEPPQRAPEPPKAPVEPAPAPAPAAVAAPAPASAPAAAPVPDPEGAHAEGTSVNDLLAAYGNASDTQRRRRRRA